MRGLAIVSLSFLVLWPFELPLLQYIPWPQDKQWPGIALLVICSVIAIVGAVYYVKNTEVEKITFVDEFVTDKEETAETNQQ